ncbi:Cthe_2314 family HEPN domain-containing protein [Parapedobacter sp. DT-150]|uniref:Cthe_2314 family HEPN domain-containing protein n=1 Tax=Parapedobacter sp. DT-150 TaxID=3396162 RepID=UPI003F1A0218
MTSDKITSHRFTQNLINDSRVIARDHKFRLTDIEFEEDPDFTEYEYYIHNTGFYCVHLLELCRQLENAVNLISNFRYDKKNEFGRVDHLVYNIENYMIRLTSLSDRVLQVINATFHLAINEKDVNERVIINNLKVARTSVAPHFNEFKKTLKDYTGERNTIVHRHSYLNKQLLKIQVFYDTQLTKGILEDNDRALGLKEIRKTLLTKFIVDRKKEYEKTNENCFEKLMPLLDDLAEQYEKMKQSLK